MKPVAKPKSAEVVDVPAQRGDLCVASLERVDRSAIGAQPCKVTTSLLGVVTNITRAGRVKEFAYFVDSLGDTRYWDKRGSLKYGLRAGQGFMVVGASRFSASAIRMLEQIPAEYASLDALRAALRPFLKPVAPE